MYDVVIIGAGPAGLFAAYELITKNRKLKILLLDKGRFASNRVCPMNKDGGKCLNCNHVVFYPVMVGLEHFLMENLILYLNSENQIYLST